MAVGVFLTVDDAASLSNVHRVTINYHIKKSKKLKALWDVEKSRWFVSLDSLLDLYPETDQGTKQKLGTQTHTNVVVGTTNALKSYHTVKLEPTPSRSYDSIYGTTRENLI